MGYLKKFASPEELFNYFELPKIEEWIERNGYKRIALQFPTDYHGIASEIYFELERRMTPKNNDMGRNRRQFFLLADTLYRSCCLDEITAEHANCDSLVHFGDACFACAIGKIPAFYIFCKPSLDLNNFKEQIQKHAHLFENSENQNGITAVVLCDSLYMSLEDEIESALKSFIPQPVVLCKLCQPKQQDPEMECEQNNSEMMMLGRKMPPDFRKNNNSLLIFVGSRESPLLALFHLTFPACSRLIHYVPEESRAYYSDVPTNKMLLKRLYLVERVRDAHTIGLVIGSVTLKHCKTAIERIRKLCRAANKKLYVFHIGKLNEAKLTNFGMEVDVFIMLSCPYGIVLESNKFYKPIVSMVEAEMALNQNNDFYTDFAWTAEFQKLVKGKLPEILASEMTDLSLVSGTVRSQGRNINAGNLDSEDNKQLMEYSAGDYFARRTWKGLDEGGDSIENSRSDTSEIKKGLSGIASHYEEEPVK